MRGDEGRSSVRGRQRYVALVGVEVRSLSVRKRLMDGVGWICVDIGC
jgi:hypothetical protein